MAAERLGDIFIRRKLINHEQLEAALQDQVHTGEFLGEIIVRLGFVKEDELLKVLAEQFNTRYVDLNEVHINPVVVKLVPKTIVWEHKILPIDMRSGVLLIAMSNPLDIWPLSVLEERLGLEEVQYVIAKKQAILEGIRKHYGEEGL